MKYSGVLLFAILLSGCAGMGNNINEPLAIDRIRKNFSQKEEVVLKDSKSIIEDSIPEPVVQQIKFVVPKISHGDDTYGEGYDGPTENIGMVEGSDDELVGPETLNEPVSNEDEIFTYTDDPPQFPGGQIAMRDYLSKNIEYPVMAKEQGIEGNVYVGFVVDKEGNIKDVTIKRGIGGGCDQEAKRVVSKMPKWIPGKMNGKNVNVSYIIPISFKLL